jgi:hypothetical protein
MNRETILRVDKADRKSYVIMDTRPLGNDPRLSWKAKGMLAYLLGKPNDWTVRIGDLVKRASDGEHAVRTGLDELEKCGYITRHQERKKDGTFAPMECVVREAPIGGFPVSSSNTDFPHADKPEAEKPDADNQDITNDDSTNDHDTNMNKPSASPSGRGDSSDGNGHKEQLPPHQQSFAMLARVCKIKQELMTDKQRGQLNAEEKRLRSAGVTADDIFEFGKWWYKHWWMSGDGNQPPRPSQVRENWGAFEDWYAEQGDDKVVMRL